MRNRTWTAALVCAVVLGSAASAAAADENATLLRVFLRDGTSLVSYGEPARVGDRVVFSMPIDARDHPALHLVNLPSDRIDWERTDRYASSARAAQYLKSQAELDYTTLSSQLTQTLNDVAAATDAAQRLAIVERARSALLDWPRNHYNYRRAEIAQMIGMLDEAIADLRAASGVSRFDIALSAFSEPPAPPQEPLLPAPTLRESIEQVLAASRVVDNAAERVSLLSAALGSLERDRAALPVDWVLARATEARAAMAAELRVDASYRAFTSDTLAVADRRAKAADVRGLERLVAGVHARDAELGQQRPEAVAALVAAVQEKLDAARRLRLARDRWELRLPVLAQYGTAIRAPFALFAQLKPALEDIKSLAGSSPGALTALQQGSARLLAMMSSITPPEETAAAHAVMLSAAQMALNAVTARREATLANDMDRAWNASSAAAGALMLGARARTDILFLLRPPQPR